MLKKLQQKAGYVSIETVIVAGLMIGLGVFAMTEFYAVGQLTTDSAIERINQVLEVSAGPAV